MKQYTNNTITDRLLVRFLTGEADASERETVLRWLDSSEANRDYYNSFVSAAVASTPQVDTDHINVEDEWQIFKAGVEEAPPARRGKVLAFSRPLLRIAAVFLLLAGVAVAYLLMRPLRSIEFASGEQVRTTTLPDGSTITLNKRSSLKYNGTYNDNNRDIQLNGEAFFAVAADNRLPFIIHAGDVQVEVLGTSFNVKSAADKTEIIVETGKVRVRNKDATIYLNAGEKATLHKEGQLPVKRPNADPLYRYYRTKQFVCNGTPLRELVAALNNVYDKQIALADESIGELAITTTFTDKSTTEIVAVICATLQLTALQQGDKIILKKRTY